MTNDAPRVSIIIPTYLDQQALQCCLYALSSQTFSFNDFEVLVVDNKSPFSPLDLVVPSEMNVRFCQEAKPGSYAARNLGIYESRGEVLAFLDADCVPENDWLAAGIWSLDSTGADLLAGCIELTYRSERLMPAECFEKAFAFRQLQNVKNGVSVTANLFVRKQVFTQVGTFDEEMMSGGDFEWTRRATTRGNRLVYCQNAVIRHPARMTLKALCSKARRVSAGSRALYREKRVLDGIRRVASVFLSDIDYLRQRSDMTHRERFWALLVLVYIKVVKVRHRLTLNFSGNRMAQGRER
ncbi:glycosyltransferase family 2 protein [Chromohalobacter canadensis]|uniref:Glycosyltransferase n=1 Tax=Chromohalobacter canadensis TaxID=141389 RepID=A0ABZ0YCC6_9GAMM|nr:glycosyltransferase [Chromohalobacter canadensis]MCK0770253.1 glycosyltransferase [Chromohalobacter canadensis]WQH08930.1 glycosyltransferase [Chromohalobacter canadensis]